MKKMFQKHQILESLNDLDNAQTEQVLNYIKGMLERKAEKQTMQTKSKREAMIQIRQALSKPHPLHR